MYVSYVRVKQGFVSLWVLKIDRETVINDLNQHVFKSISHSNIV